MVHWVREAVWCSGWSLCKAPDLPHSKKVGTELENDNNLLKDVVNTLTKGFKTNQQKTHAMIIPN